MKRDLPIQLSAIILASVMVFNKELDQETLRMCIFLGKDCVKGNDLLKILWMPLWIWSDKSLISPFSVSHPRAFLFSPYGTSLKSNQSKAKSFFSSCCHSFPLKVENEGIWCPEITKLWKQKARHRNCLHPAQHRPAVSECFLSFAFCSPWAHWCWTSCEVRL